MIFKTKVFNLEKGLLVAFSRFFSKCIYIQKREYYLKILLVKLGYIMVSACFVLG